MSKPPLYAIPVLGRYGLAHGMLSWARCRLWCEQNGVTMLSPFWLKLRIGPYLRRERDKRNYFLLFHAGGAISGLRYLWLLATSRHIDVGPEWPDVSAGVGQVVAHYTNTRLPIDWYGDRVDELRRALGASLPSDFVKHVHARIVQAQ